MLANSRRIGSVLLLIAVLVDSARVAAHTHNPIDIVGSPVTAALAAGAVQATARI